MVATLKINAARESIGTLVNDVMWCKQKLLYVTFETAHWERSRTGWIKSNRCQIIIDLRTKPPQSIIAAHQSTLFDLLTINARFECWGPQLHVLSILTFLTTNMTQLTNRSHKSFSVVSITYFKSHFAFTLYLFARFKFLWTLMQFKAITTMREQKFSWCSFLLVAMVTDKAAFTNFFMKETSKV